MISQKTGILLLLILTTIVAVTALLVPRIPQPPAYHLFADRRAWLGVANFGDVVSNLPFAVIGLWALAFLARAGMPAPQFLDPRERVPYFVVFVGLVLTAFGSAYYHLHPDNARLVWDRLPMTIVFVAMVATVIAERISVRAGLWLLPLLLAIGAGSVVIWYRSELRGAGDLRLYAAVQVYSALVLLTAPLFPARYTRGPDLGVVVGFYALAKALEILDQPIFALGHIVSGHTLKHLAGAAAGYWILRMVAKRTPLAQPSMRQTSS